MSEKYLKEFDTDNYEILIGESHEEPKIPVYAVMNKRTGLKEVEETMLPRAIEYMRQLDQALTDYENNPLAAAEVPDPPLLPH